jgi:N-acetylmuramoyl-L-alanine amidase
LGNSLSNFNVFTSGKKFFAGKDKGFIIKQQRYRQIMSSKMQKMWPILLVLASVVYDAQCAHAISLSQELPRRKVVVVDPGHGGHDIGAVGPSGLEEKVVTLSVARKIKEILFGTYEVHLTRNDDYGIDIEHRTAVANHYRADIFISLHEGGGFRHQARGVVILYYGSRTGMESRPPREQMESWETGEKLLPWDYIQSEYTSKSQLLAKLVHGHLLSKLSIADSGVREAPCFVLRGADMPAILVEVGNLSHPADEKELGKPEVISVAAEAICEGIREYFTRYP